MQAAIEDGTLPFDRWTSYKKLQRELAHLERRLDKRLQAEERKRWAKAGARAARTCGEGQALSRRLGPRRRPERPGGGDVETLGRPGGQPTFAAPWVTVVVNAQSVAASSGVASVGNARERPIDGVRVGRSAGAPSPSTRRTSARRSSRSRSRPRTRARRAGRRSCRSGRRRPGRRSGRRPRRPGTRPRRACPSAHGGGTRCRCRRRRARARPRQVGLAAAALWISTKPPVSAPTWS